MKCEIILTGNELLIGKTQDTNGFWLIQQLNPLGCQVTRISIIQDNLNDISSTIKSALNRKPDYIFTSGGLGPTFDDMTLEGIAKGLSPAIPLEVNVEAEQMILERYQNRYPQTTLQDLKEKYPYYIKMATIPQGATPLRNPEGTAPAVFLSPAITNDITSMFVLPGIPSELEAIFLEHILPIIRSKADQAQFLECGFRIEKIPESGMAQKISSIKDQYPELWIKTHPQRSIKNNWQLELHISTFSTSPLIIPQLQEVYQLLLDFVVTHGGSISNPNPVRV